MSAPGRKWMYGAMLTATLTVLYTYVFAGKIDEANIWWKVVYVFPILLGLNEVGEFTLIGMKKIQEYEQAIHRFQELSFVNSREEAIQEYKKNGER